MNNKPLNIKKIIVEICRVCLGLLFIFSGFVKAIDPWGTAIKNAEYLEAFGLGDLDFAAMPLGIIQIAIEFGLGVFLLMGIYRRFNTIFSLLFMLVMTPLTLYLAIKNPITDCGCFGDALVISNWATFYKNLFLLAAAVIVVLWHKQITPVFSHKSYNSAVLWTYVFILGFCWFTCTYLPIVDFRPYKIGANIPSLMTVPEDAEHDVYETVLIYKKNGVEQEFTLENYPKSDDTTWVFVDQKSKLIKKGYEPPIHDFTITTANEDDITEEVLSDTSYTFLLISSKFKDASDVHVDRINALYDYSRKYGYRFYALTSSPNSEIAEWKSATGAEYPVCTTDETPLKTIIRSNPGLLLLKNGTIINKWPDANLPQQKLLDKPLVESKLVIMPHSRPALKIFVAALIFCIPMAVLYAIDVVKRRKRHSRKHSKGEKD
ncbi:MAG: DoxX family protein [Dysgonamonadaceae bacterium]|jgi:uncharacterized membrane protein YphA (DoxX/SURF4 family)|nr:DoxX family protein [Dysgonamonadaceae bacterium]